VVTNPAFVYWRGDVYRRETDGAARAWLYRARSLVAAGVPVAAASDAPVVAPDPWLGMAAARTRRTRDGRTLAPASASMRRRRSRFATTQRGARRCTPIASGGSCPAPRPT
jgi:predicted amidohydrolase YtcJ